MYAVFFYTFQDLNNIEENWKVCEVCQKSVASFQTLLASWLIANEWNEDNMKDIDKFEMMEEIIENNECSDISVTNISTTKRVKSKNGQLHGDGAGSSNTKIKTEIDEISDFSLGVPLNSKHIKKVNVEDIEFSELQLKNEEVDIKDEDG